MNEYRLLEDGFKNLDVRSSENNVGLEEDGDVTPTNSPPTHLTAQSLIQFPISSNTSGFCDSDFVRFSSSDEYDMRSNSSLSWGEDEFEGEATRIVNALFDQLDKILYNDDISKLNFVPVPTNKNDMKKPLQTEKNKSKFQHLNIEKQFSEVNDQSLTEDDNYESFNLSGVNIPEPSATLKSECKEWTTNFPHFRVTGISVDMQRLSKLELLLFADEEQISLNNNEDETIAQDGEYENKLQFVTLKQETNQEKKDHHRRNKGPPSRICSGSSDPEVLKEQILIKLFDFLWPTVTEVVEPLLNNYAHYVINQSVQYSSISREPSTKGQRAGSISMPQRSTNIPPINWRTERPVSAIIRSPSPIFKLPSRVPTENASREELQKLLQISSKPLFYPENGKNIRSMSASKVRESASSSQTSVVSLPILLNHRPVSSKSSSHLLTPRLKSDQRPSSNSSFTRLRFNDRYMLNRTAIIEENKTNEKTSDMQNRVEEFGSPSPTWSRHSSFLPPISDIATFVQGKGRGQPRIKGNGHNDSIESTLSVKGQSLSATSKTNNNTVLSPQNDTSKCASPAEPFVSWIVSKVEQHSTSNLSSHDHVSQHVVDRKSKQNSIDKTKYYRRSSHH